MRGRNRALFILLHLVLLRNLQNTLFNLLLSGPLSCFRHLQLLLIFLPVFYFILQLVPFFKAQHLEYLLLQFWPRSKEHILHAHVEELQFFSQAIGGSSGLYVLFHGLNDVHILVSDNWNQIINVVHIQLLRFDTAQPDLVQDHLDLLFLRVIILLLLGDALLVSLDLSLLLLHLLLPLHQLLLLLSLTNTLLMLQFLLLLFLELLLLSADFLFDLERRSLVVFRIGLFGSVALFDHRLGLQLGQILIGMAVRLSVGAFEVLLHFFHPVVF